MKVKPISEWHEDLGSSIFISFGRDENGKIEGSPPELYWGSAWLEDDFDETKWTHFIDGDFNFVFSDVDPVNFPETTPRINLDKRACIDLVTSLNPSWDLIYSGRINAFGEIPFSGNWIWNRNSLRKLTNEKLYEFYLRVRKGEIIND